MKKLAVIGIVIKGDRSVSVKVQEILTKYGDVIIGRMGVPDRVNNLYALSVIVEGENETLSALSGQLGKLQSVSVKTATTAVEI